MARSSFAFCFAQPHSTALFEQGWVDAGTIAGVLRAKTMNEENGSSLGLNTELKYRDGVNEGAFGVAITNAMNPLSFVDIRTSMEHGGTVQLSK